MRELSKPQRRVLGVLVEKAYTVPESYPMTIKSLIAGCNQKSNRAPITNYNEDAVIQALDELRAMGVAAVVHTESGRTERYRHYVRKRFPFTEPQLAIITELLLRGRQQMGELRARASRMVAVESQPELKKEIEGLLEQGYVQADGPLDRRGVEIDHNFYLPSENVRMAFRSEPAASVEDHVRDEPVAPRATRESSGGEWQQEATALRESNRELRNDLEELKQQLASVQEDLTQLRQSLGA
ncbi:DUF480 domain-containing protein [Planctomicrobium piriforme]|uniref:DUF480 domain-containing protein n=1 Tax=Planctomicrobium piriforme TaxID=1576369 RepID=UPI001FEAD463|nr:DUF480 domain-containing protein [Planctomicrobium piriforme]